MLLLVACWLQICGLFQEMWHELKSFALFFLKLNSDCGRLHIQGWVSEQADLKGRQEKQGCGQYLGGTHTRPFRAWPSTQLWRGAPRMLMCGNAENHVSGSVQVDKWRRSSAILKSVQLQIVRMKQQPSGLIWRPHNQTGAFCPAGSIPDVALGCKVVSERGFCWHRSTEEMLVQKRVVLWPDTGNWAWCECPLRCPWSFLFQ